MRRKEQSEASKVAAKQLKFKDEEEVFGAKHGKEELGVALEQTGSGRCRSRSSSSTATKGSAEPDPEEPAKEASIVARHAEAIQAPTQLMLAVAAYASEAEGYLSFAKGNRLWVFNGPAG